MELKSPNLQRLQEIAADLGMTLNDEDANIYLSYFDSNLGAIEYLHGQREEVLPAVKYPRKPGIRPQGNDNPFNAWAIKTSVKGRARGKLKGKKVVVKDNISLANVAMSNGSASLAGYSPEFDASVVTRVLDAGGEISGKAVCEYFCYSSGSHTSVSGMVENPILPGHTTGGSSSGCAALVAANIVDMAIGGDQAGSIRIPASHCGLYGMKPTWGLVPYTGIVSSEYNIDHTGPITRTVDDNALLLEVLAGDDGIDLRRSARKPQVKAYRQAAKQDLKGYKIGMVREGFAGPNAMLEVDATVRLASESLQKLGAEVEEISIPWHAQGVLVWLGFALEGYHGNMMSGNGFGTNHGGLYWSSLNDYHAKWRDSTDNLPANLKLGMLLGEYAKQEYRGHIYVKSMNLALDLSRAYDETLKKYDALLMPTCPRKAVPLPPADMSLKTEIDLAWENIENTSPFNLTHHPALSLPCGMVEGSPVGMMLVANHYDEMALYRAAYAWEREVDWRSIQA